MFNRASILVSSRLNSTGLVSKSSQPASIALSRSPDMAWAVNAITGMDRVSGAAFRRRVLPPVKYWQAHIHQD
jgi:hypothetical protein